MPTHLPPVVLLVGPTASGKTGLSLDLAERLDGEIVNTDAMQLYRGMDIGTAKLPVAERRGIPHHLLDVLEVHEAASVAQFQAWARDAVADIRGRGRTPILVGGSALYNRAVVDQFTFPGTDPDLRAEVEAEVDRDGLVAAYARLADADPAAAAAIEPGNRRRVVRALEVIALTGRPFSATLPRQAYALEGVVQIGIDIPREVVDDRIGQRVDAMWRAGLLDEVESLLARGLRESRTAAAAIGYRQAVDQLDGTLTEEQAQADTATATRRFVRRQLAWWRKDPRITWLPHDHPEAADQAASWIVGGRS
ncbi:tRNA (adenosine(37)-N6)-dimethylallyltransferase MiaA [Nocardioidaceae bacterium]|nr:tRNA (adenosine(37)-N6)-dimethylallyltransferase MiaA [Nocardioidaceae bacterium]